MQNVILQDNKQKYCVLLDRLDFLSHENNKLWDAIDACQGGGSAFDDELVMLPKMKRIVDDIGKIIMENLFIKERDIRNNFSTFNFSFGLLMKECASRPFEASSEVLGAYDAFLKDIIAFRDLLNVKNETGIVTSTLQVLNQNTPKAKMMDTPKIFQLLSKFEQAIQAEKTRQLTVFREVEFSVEQNGETYADPEQVQIGAQCRRSLRRASKLLAEIENLAAEVPSVEARLLLQNVRKIAADLADLLDVLDHCTGSMLVFDQGVVIILASTQEAMKLLIPEIPNDSLKVSDSAILEIDRLQKLAADLESDAHNTDISASLDELKRCLAGKCYIACMCLCGRMMEAGLKMRFAHIPEESRTVIYDAFKKAWPELKKKEVDDLGLGELIALSKAAGQDHVGRLPEGLANDADKIKKFRNSYAHAKDKGGDPIPSENDTRSVIHSLAEVLGRTYSHLKSPSGRK